MSPFFGYFDYFLIILSQLFRFVGLAVLGLGIGWLVLDLLKKIQVWQGQVAIFLGLAGLIIAMNIYTGWGAMGAFAIGIGVAFFMWGMPKKEKKEDGK
jgi:NhaP-type Na+/H+ or K+/H+ antiporter